MDIRYVCSLPLIVGTGCLFSSIYLRQVSAPIRLSTEHLVLSSVNLQRKFELFYFQLCRGSLQSRPVCHSDVTFCYSKGQRLLSRWNFSSVSEQNAKWTYSRWRFWIRQHEYRWMEFLRAQWPELRHLDHKNNEYGPRCGFVRFFLFSLKRDPLLMANISHGYTKGDWS